MTLASWSLTRIGVITQNRLGPREAAKKTYPNENFPEDQLPSLQKASDMIWTMWEKEIPDDRKQNLQFFMTLAITNQVTLEVMKRAMQLTGKDDVDAGGAKWFMNTDAGKALLGKSPVPFEAHDCVDSKSRYTERSSFCTLPGAAQGASRTQVH